MIFYKAIISNIQEKESTKTGSYISIQFIYESEEGKKRAYKNLWINHPKKEIADKSRQMLYKMRQKKSKNPQIVNNSCLVNAQVFISIIESETYTNVYSVYFIY